MEAAERRLNHEIVESLGRKDYGAAARVQKMLDGVQSNGWNEDL